MKREIEKPFKRTFVCCQTVEYAVIFFVSQPDYLPGHPSLPSQKSQRDLTVLVLEASIELLRSYGLHTPLQFLQHSPLQKIFFAHGAQTTDWKVPVPYLPTYKPDWITWRKYSSNYIWGPLAIAGSERFSRWRPSRKLKSPIRDFIRKEDRLERKRQL